MIISAERNKMLLTDIASVYKNKREKDNLRFGVVAETVSMSTGQKYTFRLIYVQMISVFVNGTGKKMKEPNFKNYCTKSGPISRSTVSASMRPRCTRISYELEIFVKRHFLSRSSLFTVR